jgi:nitrate reductase assembly molybdenum cofactor insertion protein NarJ
MQPLAHYEQLAALFEYPQRDYPARVQRACQLLEGRYALAAARLASFGNALPSEGGTFSAAALDEVQEIFTRSFDVQPITTLSVGYVMFGDDYKRGELLVNLNREDREAGVDCGSELPDHLPNVLRLIARWQDSEMVVEFVEEILHPALERMIAEFGSERMEQRNRLYEKHFKTLIASSAERGTIFREPLAALVTVLREDFGLCESARPEQQNDFLRSIGRELDIETDDSRPPAARSRI